ncbi:MAG TPA: hypothetical protein VHF51_08640 [Solirubrobacteraceae bacterium]|nr:hypothetical protein [Solirubrobacteraceae bacterium]
MGYSAHTREVSEMEESSTAARVLIVAYRTAATPPLIDAVRARAEQGRCAFTLLVPDLHRGVEEAETREADVILELAIPLLEEAAGGRVEGMVGAADPYRAVRDALDERDADEIMVSTLPPRVSRWLSMDLPGRLEALGKPVTVVTGPESARPVSSASPA